MDGYTCDYARQIGNSTYSKEPDIFRHRPPQRVIDMRKAVNEVNISNANQVAQKYGFKKEYLLKVAGYEEVKKTIIEQRLSKLTLSHSCHNKIVKASEMISMLSGIDIDEFFSQNGKKTTKEKSMYRAVFVGILSHLNIRPFIGAEITGVSRTIMTYTEKKHLSRYNSDETYKDLFDKACELICQ